MSDPTDGERYSPDQAAALAYALDDIIPPSPDGRLPGAGEVGVASFIDEQLRKTPELRAMVTESLAALDDLARGRNAACFAALPAADQREVMNHVAMGEHAFPPVLMLHAYVGYYQHPRIVEALGLEARAPHPKGYEVPADDPSLLDPVRRRAKFFRAC